MEGRREGRREGGRDGGMEEGWRRDGGRVQKCVSRDQLILNQPYLIVFFQLCSD